jgi:hypothetical protein
MLDTTPSAVQQFSKQEVVVRKVERPGHLMGFIRLFWVPEQPYDALQKSAHSLRRKLLVGALTASATIAILGALKLGSNYETSETQRQREDIRKQMLVAPPSHLKPQDGYD